jgi:uncharacterized protein (DUF2225 family)
MMEAITYFSKNETECPVCSFRFAKEEMLTGRGRMIAGELTPELHRLYEPSAKYGEVFPLIYPITVCPNCYYSAMAADFSIIPETACPSLNESSTMRKDAIEDLLPELNFGSHRTLIEGLASYYLAIECYDFFPKDFSPKAKQGICALRAAWLCKDLHHKYPGENYDYLSNIFYRKARFFYVTTVQYEEDGKETVANIPNLGPDLDKNYGYDGVLYLAAYLEYHHGPEKNEEVRKKRLENAKRTAARIFGMGKASKKKPAVLLENSKDLHGMITKDLKEEASGEESSA